MSRRETAALLALGAALACGGGSGGSATPPPGVPQALDSDNAVRYPPDLYDQGVDGDVVLRLFVDAAGQLVPESTRVTKSSGNAAFDSAAVRGVARMHFAPAQQNGLPLGMAFLQPVQFRHKGQR